VIPMSRIPTHTVEDAPAASRPLLPDSRHRRSQNAPPNFAPVGEVMGVLDSLIKISSRT
jgi:hypothetical protein